MDHFHEKILDCFVNKGYTLHEIESGFSWRKSDSIYARIAAEIGSNDQLTPKRIYNDLTQNRKGLFDRILTALEHLR
jgi:hypothetical protein